MTATTSPISIRLNAAEKKRIATLARKRGLSPAAYIKKAALEGPNRSDISRLARLEKATTAVLEAVEDELDARIGHARWEKYLSGKSRLLSREEFLR
jgi:hypothetical protein